MMKSQSYAAVFALLLAANAAAQFRETIEVRVLEIEATVLDRQGHPVEGLTREDFAVEIDGKPAEITSFYPVKRGATGSQPVSGAPVVAMPTRLVIIIDDLHLHPASKQHALVGLREYIERSMDPWTTAMIVTWNGNTLSARAKPTTKRETLLAALDQIAQELPRGMEADADRSSMIRMCQADSVACRMQLPHFGESRASDTDRTVRALQEVIASAGGMEGRKVVLYVSESMELLPGEDVFSLAAGTQAATIGALRLNRTREIRQLARDAQDAGVVFCTLDPSLSGGSYQVRQNARDSARLLARETGGTLIADQNDLHAALIALDDQISTYYSLGVRAPANADEGVRIEVHLTDPRKLRVLTATRRSVPSRTEAVASSIRSRLYLRREDNPLDARLSIDITRGNGCTAMMQLLLPSQKLLLDDTPIRGFVEVRFAVLDERDQESDVLGTVVTVTSKHGSVIGQGIPIRLNAQKYVLSAAIVDRASGVASYLQRDIDCH